METRRRKLDVQAWAGGGFRDNGSLHGIFADKFLPDLTKRNLNEFRTPSGGTDWECLCMAELGQKDRPDKHKGPVLDQLVAFRYARRLG